MLRQSEIAEKELSGSITNVFSDLTARKVCIKLKDKTHRKTAKTDRARCLAQLLSEKLADRFYTHPIIRNLLMNKQLPGDFGKA